MSMRTERHTRLARAAAAMALLLSLVACGSGPARRPAAGAMPSPRSLEGVAAPGADGPPDEPVSSLVEVPDAQPRVEPIRSGGPNKPYEVAGETYVPLARDEPVVETGLASWYGKKFHGRRTASGEVYNMYAMTAAHKTMPIPSFARVRNLSNGREVIVRINDRGPFVKGRIIDLSYAAAMKLGTPSLANVEVQRLTHEDIRAMNATQETGVRTASLPVSSLRPTAPPPTRASPPASPGKDETARAVPAARAPAGPAPSAAPGASGVPTVALAVAAGASPAPSRPAAGMAEPPVMDVPVAAAPAPAAPGTDATASLDAPPPSDAPVSRLRAYTQAAAGYWLQLGAFGRRAGALDFHQKVSQELDWLAPWLAVHVDGAMHRLQAGPFATRELAQAWSERVRTALSLTPLLIERR